MAQDSNNNRDVDVTMPKVQNDSSFKLASLILVVLIASGGVMLWKLLHIKPVETKDPAPVPTQTQVIAKKDLGVFALIKAVDLELRPGTDDSPEAVQKAPTIEEFSDRYLMSPVISGEEVKREMLAPREATPLLADAVTVSIPATPVSSLGGQLRVGDLVDVVAVHNSPLPVGSDQLKPPSFEKLMVLNIDTEKDVRADEKAPKEPGAITLALPASKRDEFAAALAGATVTVTRKIPVKN
jgi:Flp pilus assembly protein CpaB